jgi:hypothetical protein
MRREKSDGPKKMVAAFSDFDLRKLTDLIDESKLISDDDKATLQTGLLNLFGNLDLGDTMLQVSLFVNAWNNIFREHTGCRMNVEHARNTLVRKLNNLQKKK